MCFGLCDYGGNEATKVGNGSWVGEDAAPTWGMPGVWQLQGVWAPVSEWVWESWQFPTAILLSRKGLGR